MQKTLTRSAKEVAFVRAWCQAYQKQSTTMEFVRENGLTYSGAFSTFRRLRSLGVNLPFLRGQNSHNDHVRFLQMIVKETLDGGQ